ncbi:glycosyltransferase [Phenylobacterium aquaticum]|uniref:glycosyltransferase family protein n=1 Tax=Phenylobacterium aquaticum TaxID=1763816 RepID=UPI0026F0E065|nr:glycosyltransferase [Phenylobacterium aquaticum]
MRFILFKGQSQYGSLRLHIDQLAAALTGLGHEAAIIDLTASDAIAQLNASFQARPDAYFGIGGVGSDLKTGEASVYDALGVVYASLYVDHPIHHIPRLSTPIKRNAALFLDRSHVQFMTAWTKGRGFSQLGFLPPGANELAEPLDTSDEAFAKRDIPVLFTGTYRGAPAMPWRQEADTPARTAIEAVAQRMAADARLPLLDALRLALADEFQAELTPELFKDFLPLLQAPQAFAEACHRDRLLHELGRGGAPLTIYGAGWEPLLGLYPSFAYGGVGSFEETLHLLRRARLVLNANNGFVAGGHERVFTAMCGGAAVLSDESKYYAEAFKPGREMATYGWNRLDAVPGQIADLLADPAGLAAMARAGAKRAQAEHSWTARAAKLVKTIKQA